MSAAPQIIGSGWACTDCTVMLANDESPEDATQAWFERFAEANRRADIALGMLREDHSCPEGAEECECERMSFSWTACRICGSTLGGERHAVTFFEPR